MQWSIITIDGLRRSGLASIDGKIAGGSTTPGGGGDTVPLPVLEAVGVGQPVYAVPSGIGLGSSAQNPDACFAGFATTAAGVGFAAEVQVSGPVTLSIAQWDAVTGDTGGLVAGDPYWLAATPGMITRTPGAAVYLVQVGRAVSSTVLAIEGDGQTRL